ncbi:MAG: GAF domain-containing protein [Myxococcota bacterium]
MKHWSVTAQGVASVEVPARNWMVALGRGLDELGQADSLERLACEVLPNGTVIARDVSTGTGYVVHAVDAEGSPDAPNREDHPLIEAEDAEAESVFVAEGLPEPAGFDVRIGQASTTALACEAALEAALASVPAESGAVILQERGFLRFNAVHGPASAKLAGTRLPPGSGVAGFAMAHQRTIVVDNAQVDARHCADIDTLTGYVTRQIAVIPIGGGGPAEQGLADAMGVIEVMNLTDGQRFEPKQLAELEWVARCLAERLAR